jgi:hypothetical protein
LVTRAPAPQPQSPLPRTSPVRRVLEDLAADAASPETGSSTPGAAPGPRPVPRTAAENAARAATSEAAGNALAAGGAVLAALAVAGNAAGSRRAASVDVAAQSAATTTTAADPLVAKAAALYANIGHDKVSAFLAATALDATQPAASASASAARDAATLASVIVTPTPASNPAETVDGITVAGTKPETPAAKTPTRPRKPLLSPDDTFAAYKIPGGFDKKVEKLAKLRKELSEISPQTTEHAKKQLEVTKAENMLRKGRETGGQYREHAEIAGETVQPKQVKQPTGTPSEPSPYETWLCEEAKKQYDFDNTKAGSSDPKKTFAGLSEEEQHQYTKQYVYENRSAKLSEYHASLSSAGNIQGAPDGNRGKSFATSEGNVKFSVNLDGSLKTEVAGNLNAVVSVRRRKDNGQLSDVCDMIEFKDGKMVGFHLNTDDPGTTSQLNVTQLERLKRELDAKATAPAAPAVGASAAVQGAAAAPAASPLPAAGAPAAATARPQPAAGTAPAAATARPQPAAGTAASSAARQQGAPTTHAAPSAESIISGTPHRASAAAGQRPPAAGAPAAATARPQAAARAATKMVAGSVQGASTTTPPGLQASSTPIVTLRRQGQGQGKH